MKKNIAVAEVMTRRVLFVYDDEMMSRVHELLETNNIHHLPVLNREGKVVGMVSTTDMHRREYAFDFYSGERTAEYSRAIFSRLPVREVMSKHTITLATNDSIMTAFKIFQENLFHAIPIVDGTGILVGILSTFDLLNFAFREESLLEL